jgi:hypothetical protein
VPGIAALLAAAVQPQLPQAETLLLLLKEENV